MSITKLSPNWACQMGPIHYLTVLLSGRSSFTFYHVVNVEVSWSYMPGGDHPFFYYLVGDHSSSGRVRKPVGPFGPPYALMSWCPSNTFLLRWPAFRGSW